MTLGLGAEDQAIGHGELHFSAVDRTGAQLFFNPEELIIFRYTVGPAERASLDLACVGGDGDIRDGDIFRFARTMGDDGGVAGFFSHFDGVEGFGE